MAFIKPPAQNVIPDSARHTQFAVMIDGLEGHPVMNDLTVSELSITESMLAPSTQTTIKIQSKTHMNPVRNLDIFAGRKINIVCDRPILKLMGYNEYLALEQTIYRISERGPITDNVEQYNMHACDATLLVNSAKRVSKSWQCESPSTVVTDVLTKCVGAPRIDVETSTPLRPYFAENIHPFQVIAQQADVALYGGNDPCFLHYMSTLGTGTHHFRSLQYLVGQTPAFQFYYGEKGAADIYANPNSILQYRFPCDFDLLSDIENGINADGSLNASWLAINPFNYSRELLGAGFTACGMGGALYDSGFTNQETGPAAGTCEVKSEIYAQLRQARLSLLDHDKLALQMVVPFNPNCRAGTMIEAHFPNKVTPTSEENYGSGSYLITTATHSVRSNGVGVTQLECVSRSLR